MERRLNFKVVAIRNKSTGMFLQAIDPCGRPSSVDNPLNAWTFNTHLEATRRLQSSLWTNEWIIVELWLKWTVANGGIEVIHSADKIEDLKWHKRADTHLRWLTIVERFLVGGIAVFVFLSLIGII